MVFTTQSGLHYECSDVLRFAKVRKAIAAIMKWCGINTALRLHPLSLLHQMHRKPNAQHIAHSTTSHSPELILRSSRRRINRKIEFE